MPTPDLQLHRTFRMKETCGDLRTDVMEELTQIEAVIIKPATDARDCLAPIRKTLKKRENRRLDYEKAQEKVVKLQRKPGKTAKEEASLAKAEQEVARTAEVRSACSYGARASALCVRTNMRSRRNSKSWMTMSEKLCRP